MTSPEPRNKFYIESVANANFIRAHVDKSVSQSVIPHTYSELYDKPYRDHAVLGFLFRIDR